MANKMTTRTITARTIVHYEREMEIPANLNEDEIESFISDNFDHDNLDWEIMDYEHDYEVAEEQ